MYFVLLISRVFIRVCHHYRFSSFVIGTGTCSFVSLIQKLNVNKNSFVLPTEFWPKNLPGPL